MMTYTLDPKGYLEQLLEAAFSELRLTPPAGELGVKVPDPRFGDYTTNLPLVLAKILNRNPAELAKELADKLKQLDKNQWFAEILPVGGFINFRLSEKILNLNLAAIVKMKNRYGRLNILRGQTVMVEYTDPNPFKEFHIGHLMSNAIGESIARIVAANGAKVIRANWQGDVGMHVATAVWGVLHMGLPLKTLTASQLGKAYAFGARRLREDEQVRQEIIEINKHLFARDDKKLNKVYDAGRRVSLREFERIYRRLGTKFDYYFFESKEGMEGKAIVEEHLEDGIFEKSQGAVIFRGEKYGLHTRVFINANGLPTYEAKELGLNRKKFEVEPKLNQSIIVTGNEIKDYFKVLLKVMSLIFPDIAKKTLHIPHGMLRLPTGKMSSRTGEVITAESLLAEIKQKVLGKITKEGLSKKQKDNIAEVVAIGALKYSILRQDTGKDIVFDFDKSLAFTGDSGPYLQYTHARARSVARKAARAKIKAQVSSHSVGSEVVRMLVHFPEVVARAGQEYAPNFIAKYLLDLSAAFNKFYVQVQIVDRRDAASPYKIALTQGVAWVLKNGLELLGITAPEEM